VESVVFDSQRTKGAEASFDAAITDHLHVLENVTEQHAVITDNPQGITSVGNHPQRGASLYGQPLDNLRLRD
jgi:iron complex outermembrane receptor protein